jgi:hypothetical protein
VLIVSRAQHCAADQQQDAKRNPNPREHPAITIAIDTASTTHLSAIVDAALSTSRSTRGQWACTRLVSTFGRNGATSGDLDAHNAQKDDGGKRNECQGSEKIHQLVLSVHKDRVLSVGPYGSRHGGTRTWRVREAGSGECVGRRLVKAHIGPPFSLDPQHFSVANRHVTSNRPASHQQSAPQYQTA